MATTHSASSLPHGTTGIDLGEIVIQFRADKVVLVRRSDGGHYTLQAGRRSGVLDVHRTKHESADTEEAHETLFAIRHDDLERALGDFAWVAYEFMRLVRPLRLGWLAHNHIGIVRGLNPVTDADIAAVTKRASKKRLTVDRAQFEQNVYTPAFLEDVWDFPDGNFSLVKNNREIGIGFKVAGLEGHARLYWIKMQDLQRFAREAEPPVMDAIMRHALPPDEFHLCHAWN